MFLTRLFVEEAYRGHERVYPDRLLDAVKKRRGMMSTNRSSGLGCFLFVMLVLLALSSNVGAQAAREPIRIGII